jgi:hypothetical protein
MYFPESLKTHALFSQPLSDKLTEIYRRNYEVRSNVDPFTQDLLPFPEQK